MPHGRSPFTRPDAREWCDVGFGYPFFSALGRVGCRQRRRVGREHRRSDAPPGAHALHARPRRAPRVRGHRRAALPRDPELDPRRVPRRRRVLRDQRVPDHVAAPGGVPEPGPHRAGPVLPSARPATAARAVPAARGGRPLRRHLPARRGHEAARRHRRGPLLRHQLVADLPQPLVLRGRGPPAAAPTPLVARGRGAVLPDLAVAAHRDVQAVARPAPPDAARDPRHRSCCRRG